MGLVDELLATSRLEIKRALVRWQAAAFQMPNLLIVGAQRCGTTFLHGLLSKHPAVCAGLVKETGFFSFHFHRGSDWYKSHFPIPLGFNGITFEATPFDLLHPLAPQRAFSVLKDLRVIVLIRDPMERALSQYSHERKLGHIKVNFEEAVRRDLKYGSLELKKLALDPYYKSRDLRSGGLITRSLYAPQIVRWCEALKPENVLILQSEDLYADPARALEKVASFLQLPSWPLIDSSTVNRNARTRLEGWLPDDLELELAELFTRDSTALKEIALFGVK